MVTGVTATPESAHPVIGAPAGKEGHMSAVVLNHEQADEESGCKRNKQNVEPIVRAIEGPTGERPGQCQRYGSNHHFEDFSTRGRIATSPLRRPLVRSLSGSMLCWMRHDARAEDDRTRP